MKSYLLNIPFNLLMEFIEIAKQQVGVVEEPKNSNSGKQINEYQKAGGTTNGQPYCNAGLCYCMQIAMGKLNIVNKPFPFQPVANGTYNYAKKIGIETDNTPTVGCLMVWKNPNSFQGHIALVIEVIDKYTVRTIEFNTSPDKSGDQRDGGGVYIKTRKIANLSKTLWLRGFVKWNFI